MNPLNPFVKRTAQLSEDGLYRYLLTRVFDVGPTCTFVMLNPSTADGVTDDRTVSKCMKYALREGCSKLTIVNLFAFRATDPAELLSVEDPVGPLCDYYLQKAMEVEGPKVVAWGSHEAARTRAEHVNSVVPQKIAWQCLAVNKDGMPKHPLYCKDDAPLLTYDRGNLRVRN